MSIINNTDMYKHITHVKQAKEVYYLENECFYKDELYFFSMGVDMKQWVKLDNDKDIVWLLCVVIAKYEI